MPPRRRGEQSALESQRKDDKLRLPRVVVRVWGLISAITFISSGGYLLVQVQDSPKCKGAGAYMIVIGLIMLPIECPCCSFICPPERDCCDKLEKKIPYWARGITYLLIIITPLLLCFGLKTLLSSLSVLILALLYFFLAILSRSKKYERLQGGLNAQYKEKKNTASVSYSAFNHATATINAYKSATRSSQKTRPSSKAPRVPRTTTS